MPEKEKMEMSERAYEAMEKGVISGYVELVNDVQRMLGCDETTAYAVIARVSRYIRESGDD